ILDDQVVAPSWILRWGWQQRAYLRRPHQIVDSLKLSSLILPEKRKPDARFRCRRLTLGVASEGVNVISFFVEPFFKNQAVYP
ncbi:hypothetical protein C1Y31_32615, partial [Pseudomonas sp. FW305-25]